MIPPDELDPLEPQLRPLPRLATQELSVVSVFGPILASNLCAPAPSTLYARDASMDMGGISRPISQRAGLFLWRDADKRGLMCLFSQDLWPSCKSMTLCMRRVVLTLRLGTRSKNMEK